MPHSYASNLVHYIFSTKERFPFIDQDLESRLWPYMGGIARENGMKALVIGGTSDHVHALFITTNNLERGKSDSVDQRWFVEMDPRSISPP